MSINSWPYHDQGMDEPEESELSIEATRISRRRWKNMTEDERSEYPMSKEEWIEYEAERIYMEML